MDASVCPRFTGGEAAYAAALRTRRGTPAVFPFLRINPIPFRARFARKVRYTNGFAARKFPDNRKGGAHPTGAGAQVGASLLYFFQ